MINKFASPYYLPQLNAPFDYVIGMLKDNDIEYIEDEVNPAELKPLQLFLSYDKINDIDDDNSDPIYVSIDNEILDGHHRNAKKLINNKLIKRIKIKQNYKDAIRTLNKIQDIFEYEQNLEKPNDDEDEVIDGNVELEKGQEILQDIIKGKKSVVDGYRKKEIIENSACGNFFLLKPQKNYKKYKIEFDNLIDLKDLKIEDKDIKKGEPITYVVFKKLYPNLKIDSPKGKINLINKLVAKELKKLGYDGIKYNDNIIQSF